MDLLRGFGTTWPDPVAITHVLDYCDRTSLQVLLLLEQEDTSFSMMDNNNNNNTIELHLALLSLIEVAPAEMRRPYTDRLHRLRDRIRSRTKSPTESTTMLNGWDMLCLTLDRMLDGPTR